MVFASRLFSARLGFGTLLLGLLLVAGHCGNSSDSTPGKGRQVADSGKTNPDASDNTNGTSPEDGGDSGTSDGTNGDSGTGDPGDEVVYDYCQAYPGTDSSLNANTSPVDTGRVGAFGLAIPDVVTTGTSLRNKRIAIGGGHGFKNDGAGNFVRQRDYWHDSTQYSTHAWATVEDVMNNEIAGWLNQLLLNAGAKTVPVREISKQYNQVLITVADSGYENNGLTQVSASPATFSGRLGRSSHGYEFMEGSPGSSDFVTFRGQVPESGHYPVYIHYRDSTNRSTDIPVTVLHAGGSSRFIMDQYQKASNDGIYDYGFYYLRHQVAFAGEYYFRAGEDFEVRIHRDFPAGTFAILDAVRLGGGMGDQELNGSPSGHERWESGAWFYQQFLLGGATSPTNILSNDVTARPHAANYRAVDAFISVHNNCCQTTDRPGTMVIWDSTHGVPTESETLALAVKYRALDKIRAEYDPLWTNITWGDSGFDGDYGETRESIVPAALLEVGFFSSAYERRALADERFQKIVARGMYEGIAEYFGAGELPDPVESPFALNMGGGKIKIGWEAALTGEPATHYIVQTSPDRYSFDQGRITADSQAVFDNLERGETWYFRISAVNAAGVSRPSEVVGVLLAPAAETRYRLLIVNGFDRVDNTVNSLHYYAQRGVPPFANRANERNYTAIHGEAVLASGRPWVFDSASSEAVANGLVSLENYDLVDWYTGREGSVDNTFSNGDNKTTTQSEQAVLMDYVEQGGALLVSGSEIAWELDLNSWGAAGNGTTAQDDLFLKDYLFVEFVHDDAGTDHISRTATGADLFPSVSMAALDDGFQGTYVNKYPDVISPVDGNGQVLFEYTGGQGGGAVSYYPLTGDSPAGVLFMGFPFEIMEGDSVRADWIGDVLDLFQPQTPVVCRP